METLDGIEAVFAVVDNIDDTILGEIEVTEPRNPKVYFRDVDPVHDYSEDCFKKRFRFSKSIVIHVILPRIADSLQSETQRGLPLTPLCQLLTALRFYATGSFQIVCGDIMRISQSTVCNIVKRVSRALALLMPDFIKFPANLRNTKDEFEKLGCIGRAPGLKNVVGAIDCTHIKITKPRGERRVLLEHLLKNISTTKMAATEDPDASTYVLMTHYKEPLEYPLSQNFSFVVATVIAYLLFVLKIGPVFMKNREPYKLKNTILFYNAFQVIISGIFVVTNLQVLLEYGLVRSYCIEHDPEARKKLLWPFYIYYLGKYTELLDTIFFVLRKKYNQVSFLHVYHHASVIVGTWAVFVHGMTLVYIYVAFINSLVHFVMYFYYFMAALGPEYQKYLTWKSYITTFQLVQFVSMFMVQATTLAVSKRCTHSIVGVTYALYSTVLFFVLFFNFYMQSYRKAPKKDKAQGESDKDSNGIGAQDNDGIKAKSQ